MDYDLEKAISRQAELNDEIALARIELNDIQESMKKIVIEHGWLDLLTVNTRSLRRRMRMAAEDRYSHLKSVHE